MINRLIFYLSLCSLSGIALTDPVDAQESMPNIVLFLVDDLGRGDLGCYGHPFMITPNLDQFAQEGLRFTDCHSGSSICSPSRASILTGRASFRLGFWGLAGSKIHLKDEEITMAEVLKEKGYQTYFAGKWHLGNVDGTLPTPGDQGFDKWMVRDNEQFVTGKGPIDYKDGGSCDEVVDQSIDMLRKRNSKDPFFIEICTREPHTPLTPPEKYMKMYDNERVRELEQFIQYGRVLRPSYIDKNASELARYYYGTVTQLDQAFGRLMKTLEDLGLHENTLVIFTSDNGPEHPVLADARRDRSWGSPGEFRGMKRFMYEGGHRVVGIMRWPGVIAAGEQSDQLISSVDLFPTICDVVDVPLPGDRVFDGISIFPVLRGDPFLRDKPLFWNIAYTHSPNMALRLGKYSLLGYFDPIESEDEIKQDWIKSATLTSFELYDLEGDPRQERNLQYSEHELFILLKDRMIAILEDVQQDSPTWPDSRGKTRPINESMQIGIPGAVRK